MTSKRKKSDMQNIVAALIFAAITVFAFDYFFPTDPLVREQAQQEAPALQVISEEQKEALQQRLILEEKNSARLPIVTDKVRGSIRLTGARLDDLTLSHFRVQQNDPDSDNIVLLSPLGSDLATFADFNFAGLTNASTPWETDQKALTTHTPLILTYRSGDLSFTRTVSIDDSYMITISDQVQNNGDKPITLVPEGLLSRFNPTPNPTGISHEGFFGYLTDKREEVTWSDLKKEPARFTTQNGWFGLTDKYFFTAFLSNSTSVLVSESNDVYQVAFTKTPITLAAGNTASSTIRFFAGPKEVDLLDAYRKDGVPRFDLAIDFGWYYFLTKPFIHILGAFYRLFGNMGLAILLFAFLVRLCVFPISYKSSKSMANMKKVQPKLKEIQNLYKGDKQRISMETMKLYKENGINPLGGCLPMLIQIPIFFSLYKVLSISIEMRGAPFFGWIQDLSAPDPSSVFTLFGLVNWPIPTFLDIGVWPVLMGLTMYLQQKLSPQPTMPDTGDKNQPNPMAMMKWMPLLFTFLLGRMAAGLVIYWTWSNLLGIVQQWYINRRVNREKK